MTGSTVFDNLKKCAALEKPSRIPLIPFAVEFNMRYAGMTYRQARLDLDKTVRMTCDTVEEFHYDWAMVFPDDFVEWESFGCEVMDEEDIPTTARKHIPATREVLKAMTFPDFSVDRMPIHLESIRQVRKNIDDSVCVASRVAAPFTSLALLFGVEALMLSLIDDQDFVVAGMEKLTPYIVRWGKAQQEAGAEILWVGDVLAGSQFISPEHYEEFALPYARRIITELQECGIFLIYHAAEKSVPHLQLESGLGVNVLNIGENVDIPTIRPQLGGSCCLSGNINTLGTLRSGTPDEVREETARMIDSNKQAPGYIFCTSEGTPQDTPPENVAAMMDEAVKHAVWNGV
jgi:uroporphyrinogen decarboxylase